MALKGRGLKAAPYFLRRVERFSLEGTLLGSMEADSDRRHLARLNADG
jgi:hypothetical protein